MVVDFSIKLIVLLNGLDCPLLLLPTAFSLQSIRCSIFLLFKAVDTALLRSGRFRCFEFIEAHIVFMRDVGKVVLNDFRKQT